MFVQFKLVCADLVLYGTSPLAAADHAPPPDKKLQIISEMYQKRISGATLISMVNSDRLGEVGITKLNRVQLLWHLEVRNVALEKNVYSAPLPPAPGSRRPPAPGLFFEYPIYVHCFCHTQHLGTHAVLAGVWGACR